MFVILKNCMCDSLRSNWSTNRRIVKNRPYLSRTPYLILALLLFLQKQPYTSALKSSPANQLRWITGGLSETLRAEKLKGNESHYTRTLHQSQRPNKPGKRNEESTRISSSSRLPSSFTSQLLGQQAASSPRSTRDWAQLHSTFNMQQLSSPACSSPPS